MPAPVDNGLLGRGDVGCECLAFGEWRDLVFASPEHEGRHLDRLDNSVDVVFPTGDRFDERVDGVAISGVEFSREELLDELIGDQLLVVEGCVQHTPHTVEGRGIQPEEAFARELRAVEAFR